MIRDAYFTACTDQSEAKGRRNRFALLNVFGSPALLVRPSALAFQATISSGYANLSKAGERTPLASRSREFILNLIEVHRLLPQGGLAEAERTSI